MWPAQLMPDPRGAKRLLPFDCKVSFKKTTMKVPKKIDAASDFISGTKKAKLIDKAIWLVEIVMPKDLITDIRTGSIEMEGQDVDLEDLDLSYEEDIEQNAVLDDNAEDINDEMELQDMDDDEAAFG